MAATGNAVNNIEEEDRSGEWADFTDKQAKLAAVEFSKSWKLFLATSSNQWDVETKELSTKFIEQVSKHLDLNLSNEAVKIHNGATNNLRSASADDILEAASDEAPDSPSPRSCRNQRPFFRRLSFKGLRKGKGLFLKQHSDEVELSPHHDKPCGRTERHKCRTLKIQAECVREGTVQLLSGDTQEGRPHWNKSRMALVKVAAGFMIEFYTPPKSMKPCTGVFCLSVCEVRETTDLEMPDLRNTFVVKADNGTEWVIDAQDQNDMRGWLTTIVAQCAPSDKELNRSTEVRPNTLYLTKNESSQSLAGAVVSTTSTTLAVAEATEPPPDPPPSLPPRLPSVNPHSAAQASAIAARLNSLSQNSRSMNGNLGDSSGEDNDAIIPSGGEGDIYNRLKDYPWFHGMLSRCDAATAVLQESLAGHGIFLVRQSETRKGEYVLTFNYQGRAKHLRMTINPDGMCRVQHYTFPAIFDLLEYFRDNHIPLESGGNSDVTLSEYVIASNYITRQQQAVVPNTAERRVLDPPDAREMQTHGGSVRLTTALLQRMQYEASSSAGSTGRAVENTYTFT